MDQNNGPAEVQTLKGMSVLITRPQPQAEKLANYLSQLGAKAVIMPMLEICPCHADELPQPLDLGGYDKIIVISTSAAECLFKHKPVNTINSQWLTLGCGTGEVLAKHGIQAKSPTILFTSEALLELPDLENIVGQRVLLVKGEGGRDLLEERLKQGGAEVTSLVVYRRRNPHYDAGTLDRTLEEQGIHAIVATSGQIVTNLISHCSEASTIRERVLLVPSSRVSDLAKQAGFNRIKRAASAGDDDIAFALMSFVSKSVN